MTSLYPFVVNRRVRVRDRRDGDDGRVSLSIEIEAVRMRMRKENAAPLSWTELASHSSRMVFLSENMITRENNKYKNKECKREAEAIESETHSSLDVSLSLFTDYTFFSSTMDMHYGERQAQRAVISGGGRVRISVLPRDAGAGNCRPTCHMPPHNTPNTVTRPRSEPPPPPTATWGIDPPCPYTGLSLAARAALGLPIESTLGN